jgi:protein-S-isoprenylcysteine O-methyltransferase Ste14
MRPPHIFLHHPVMTGVWLATYLLWIIPEFVVSRRRPEKDAQDADRGSKLVVIMTVNISIFLGFLAATAVPGLFVGAHWRTIYALGIAVWLAGIALRLYSIRILGRFFTFNIAISSTQRVIEQGPYRWLRHPSYLGGLLALLGFGMTLTNWLAMLLPVCCMTAGYIYRIRIEEQALVHGLGPAYSEYMRRTWRLIPYVF